MLRLNHLRVPLDYTDASLRALLLKKLSLSPAQLLSFRLIRRSVDARDKGDVHFVLSLDLAVKDEAAALKRNPSLAPAPELPRPPLPRPPDPPRPPEQPRPPADLPRPV